MKLTDYCDAIGAELILYRYTNQGGRWTAKIDKCEVKDGGRLSGEYGESYTPEGAMAEYCKKIAGKHIVLNAGSESYREFDVPTHVGI